MSGRKSLDPETPKKIGKESQAQTPASPKNGAFSKQHFFVGDDVLGNLETLLTDYMRREGATKSTIEKTMGQVKICFTYKTCKGFHPECVFVLPGWIHDRDTHHLKNSAYCIKQNAEGEITGLKQEITGLKQEITGLKQEITGLNTKIEAIKDIVQ